MITVLIGDLFNSQAQTLVNTVNCVGIMGKGIALQFKERFPDMFADYQARCSRGEVQLGKPYLFKRLLTPWVLNFPTKDHWRSVSRLADIVRGLEYLEQNFREWEITSLAVPPLGCGQGGLEWRVVGPTMYRYLSKLEIPLELYAPAGTPDEQMQTNFLARSPSSGSEAHVNGSASKIHPAWVAVVEILRRITEEPYHWPVGRTTFQKLAYFATQAGLPTGLRFHRGSYGPFSEEIKPMVTRLVNNGVLQEERAGRMFRVLPGVAYGDAASTYHEAISAWEPIIDRIADLFLRLDTNRAEVAATVDFAARELTAQTGHKSSETEVLAEVMRWKQRRRPPLEESLVAEEIRGLNLFRWLDLQPSPDLPVSMEAMLDV